MTKASAMEWLKTGLIAKLGVLLAVAAAVTFAVVGPASADEHKKKSDGDVAAIGKAEPKIILTLGTSAVDLSGVDPDCAKVSGTSEYDGISGNEGCAYVWTVSVQVESNRAWKGSLKGTDNGVPTSEVTVANANFHASIDSVLGYSDCTSSQVVETDEWTWENAGKKGNNLAVHYQCVVVDWDNDDGTIDSTISYSVTQ